MRLRDYQKKALDRSLEELCENRSTICVMATGLGKTVVLAAVAQQFTNFSGKALVLAHRSGLIRQNAETIESFTGERCDIEMADEVAGIDFGLGLVAVSKYISSTIQTQSSRSICRACRGASCDRCDGGKRYRFQKFDPNEFSLVVLDEAHHATAKSWRTVIDHYGKNPDCKFLFLTATPKRSDKVALRNVCESVAFEMGISEGIERGWLVPLRGKHVHVDDLDISKVKKSSTGELSDAELEAAMIGDGSPLNKVASAIAKEGRKAIVFTVGKRHSALMAEALRTVGVRAESITEDTPHEDRENWKRMLASDQLDALVGVDVLTEGFDVKQIGLVACVRPTLSVSTMTQMVGRGTRPLSGVVDGPETPEERKAAIASSAKPDCLVLDFVGNTGRHKLASVFDVLGGDALPEDVRAARKRAKEGEVDVQDAIDKAREDRERKEAAALARKPTRQLSQSHDYHEREVDLFAENDVPISRPASRGRGGATQKQVNYMVYLGYTRQFAESCGPRQAGKLIDKRKRERGMSPAQPQKAPAGSSAERLSVADIFEALR
ncbi:SSL2 DNA or RNA helicases of superfamily II [uncultured Caudovirales phage]|uniref:SSL2 DNA or RNA helicases of superfamily II n=1 Tax=uncultured Caudovirales phage TaxID=2100421 RepID=A0A6J5QEJ3_9CAUD|nr:SSL2 DNA or RNA helicases of superfamily II [uncultured Caudovirales phage]